MSLTSLSALASVSGFVKGNPSIDYYKVLGFSPELVADFDDEYYRANRQKTTFDGLLTHSRLSRATMVDSDGLIKWGPHNLLTYSEEFDNAAWGKSSVGSATAPVVVPNDAIAPNGTNTADKVTFSRSGDLSGDFSQLVSAAVTVEAVNYTGGVWLKAATSSDIGKQLGVRHVANSPYQVHTLTAEWVKVSNVELGVPGTRYFQIATRGTITADRDVSAHIWGAHLYRSDLGGMVNNPDTGNSYVPTTSSAVYLPRRGHHVWNGSAWVNEGLLIETEARTNLLHTTNALVTQTITVTAVPHTLHFTGTGTVTLSGASTDGPLVGTGTGEQNRVSLTFTPTAGLLMLIVTGTVADAQLEVGSTPSSYIPNLAASGTVNRTPDILTIPSANLPWPTPKVIGPELVTNGTFDSDVSGWANQSGGVISWDSGELRITPAAGDGLGFGEQAISTTAGAVYVLTLDITENTADRKGRFYVGTSASLTNIYDSGTQQDVGPYSVVFTAIGSTTYIGFGSTHLVADGLGYTNFDNISVREIDPLAVSIQMDGRVTYADEDAGGGPGPTDGQHVFLAWDANVDNHISVNLTTASTDEGKINFRQRAAATVDFVPSSGTALSPGILVPYNIASRHGSTFINGAVDGTALNADNTPVALPDLSSTNLSLAHDYMGCIRQFRVWAADLGDSGIAEASEGEPSSYLIWDASADTYIQKVYD